MRIRDYVDPWVLAIAAVMVAIAVLVSACFPRPTPQHPKPVREAIVKFVKCIATPPPVEAIDWPDSDRLGNYLLHKSTADRLKEAYAILVRYAWAQFYKCLAMEREASGIAPPSKPDDTTTVTDVEVEP